jgi:hypothetical protein
MYVVLVVIILVGAVFLLNNRNIESGTPISTIDAVALNQNAQSSKIQNLIFAPTNLTKNINYLNQTAGTDKLDNYVVNIFCSEVTSKYVKVASGSGVFLSDPNETNGVIVTNAHVARHLLDSNKKCVGRTGSPTATTLTLTLRYIPSYWLNNNGQYVIGDPDQSTTGEFDFAIIESKRIKPLKKDTTNIYNALTVFPKLKISNYDENTLLNTVYIYSYPAQQSLSKNVYNALYQKKDTVRVSGVYTSPTQNIRDSLLDVSGSKYIDHGSSGGMVISQGSTNSIMGLSSVLIKDNPQIVRVVTMKHVLATLENDLKSINNAQTDSFLSIIRDTLTKKDVDLSVAQILKNIKLTSVLEQYTRTTLRNLNIIR